MSLVWSSKSSVKPVPPRGKCQDGKCSIAPSLSKKGTGEGQNDNPLARNQSVSIHTEKLAFKRWLLYVLPEDKPSLEAMQLVVQIESDVHITNIARIARDKRPAWLVGVPTLVDLRHQLKYEGSAALDEIRKYVEADPMPVCGMAKQYFKLGEKGDTEQDWGAPAGLHDYIMPDLTSDPRYEMESPIKAAHVQAFQDAREMQLAQTLGGKKDSVKLLEDRAPITLSLESLPSKSKSPKLLKAIMHQ